MSPSAAHTAARVKSVEPSGSRGVHIELDVALDARPGQFVMLWLPGVDEKPLSLVDNDPVSLAVVRVGPFTERMQHVRAGDVLYLRGPLGNGFTLSGERPLLIAGGCGAAPLAFLAKMLKLEGRPFSVAIGARTAHELLLEERFAAADADILVSTDDGSRGEQGLVTDMAECRLALGEHDMVYACGPGPMLHRVTDLCRAYGVRGELSWEAYMRCGIGVCGSCDRGDGLLVCRDGPVFPSG